MELKASVRETGEVRRVGREPEDLDDGAVIRASLRDPERFGQIFDRHADAVHGYLWRRAGASAAGELLGDVFCTAFERRERFQLDRTSARPWLYGIATNHLQHWWRSRARADAAFRRVANAEVGAAELDLDALVARLDAAGATTALRTFLAGLPHDRLDLLVLWACEELTYPELADALGLPIGTVRSRIHRLRAAAVELIGTERENDGVTADPLPSKGTRP
jgi:RNA polymerase sigma factor (sigma-70 family)